MLSKQELERYKRHILLPEIGHEGQMKLKNAKVLVIGAGGLGCPVLQYLSAAGIGIIGIIDFDTVDESNLQRQILFTSDAIGKAKVEEASAWLKQQNPFVSIVPYNHALNQENALDIISKYDVIVDGSDNYSTRYLINDACVLTKKPLVYGSIYRFQGQISVFNYKNNSGSYGPTYRCFFPFPPNDSAGNCSKTGVLGVLPGIIGTLQANETIKLITGTGEVLSGKVLIFDALSMIFREIKIKRSSDIYPRDIQQFYSTNYRNTCKQYFMPNEITVSTLLQRLSEGEEIQIIDIREPNEPFDVEEIKITKIPSGELLQNPGVIDTSKTVVIMCKGGTRSLKAIEILKEKGFNNLYSLKGGILELMRHDIQSYSNLQ